MGILPVRDQSPRRSGRNWSSKGWRSRPWLVELDETFSGPCSPLVGSSQDRAPGWSSLTKPSAGLAHRWLALHSSDDALDFLAGRDGRVLVHPVDQRHLIYR